MIPCLIGITRSALSIVVMVVAHGNVVRPLGSEDIILVFVRLIPVSLTHTFSYFFILLII